VKISLIWIADFVDLPRRTAAETAHDLTMATVEVEGVEAVNTPDGQDTILEVDNKSLTNRPDLWGHYGLARELSAIYDVPLKPLPGRDTARQAATLLGTIDPATTARFSAAMVTGVTNAATPSWMSERLKRVGQRPINVFADLTNYLMLTVGQPCHAYDADKLSLPLSVRRASPGERFVALDGTECRLQATDLVVADAKGPVALAGVIGGLDSAVGPSTSRVLLEAASFDALTVRRTSTSTNLRTDASSRFEKALSTQGVDSVQRYFAYLLHEILPGATISGYDDRVNATTPARTIEVDAAFLRSRIGEPLSIDHLSAPLKRLGFGVTARGEHLTVSVPTWRNTGDISGPHDLVEEIARLHGYERFEFRPPVIRLNATARQFARGTERRLKEFLASAFGMQEVVNYPWPDEADVAAIGGDAARTALRLHAPPAPEQGSVRTSLLPGLLKSIRVNLRWQSSFRIFEAGRVFPGTEVGSIDDEREQLPKESRRLAAALVGDDAAVLFRSAKGIVEQLSRRVHVGPVRREPGPVPSWADPAANLTVASDAGIAGQLGVLNLRASQAAGLKRVFVVLLDVDLDRLVAIPSRENAFRQLPRLPSIDIDVTMVYADTVRWEAIARQVAAVNPLIAEVQFLDEYRGKEIPKGSRALSLRARLQHESRTLAMEEATAVGQAIRDDLQRTLSATAR